MLSITKQTINSQKIEIAQFAWKKFRASFISVLNGKNRYLERSNYGFAHLRFTQIFEKTSSNTFRKIEDRRDYKDFYFYVTSSTTTDYNTNTKQKLEENLTDRCFNVRSEVLFSHSDSPNMYFLIDYGKHWAYCSREYARKHIIKTNFYEGREVCTIRLAQGDFVEKEHTCDIADEGSSVLSFDATFIQNVTYSKYRKRGGLVKVEVFKNSKLQAIKYYISLGELKDDFEAHGHKYSKEYFRLLAKRNSELELDGKVFKFSRAAEVNDLTTTTNNSSLNSSPCEQRSCCNHYDLPPIPINLNLKEGKNVMVTTTNGETTKEESLNNVEENEELKLKLTFKPKEAKKFVMITDLD